MRQTRSFMEREAVNSVKKQCFFKQIERLSLLVEYGEMAEWSNAADSVIYGTRSGQLCKKNVVFFERIERRRIWLNKERWQSGRMRQTRNLLCDFFVP